MKVLYLSNQTLDGVQLLKNSIGDNQPIESLLVINDKYVELRKALAEGKTVEADVNYWSHPSTSVQNWKRCPQDSFHKYSLESLRIKPIEFKLGDWITNHGKLVVCVTKTDTEFVYFKPINKDSEGSLYLLKDKQFSNNIELWQPKPNEWCWFWDIPKSKHASIAQFKELYKGKFKSANFTWNFCAPFIGELPPHLKD